MCYLKLSFVFQDDQLGKISRGNPSTLFVWPGWPSYWRPAWGHDHQRGCRYRYVKFCVCVCEGVRWSERINRKKKSKKERGGKIWTQQNFYFLPNWKTSQRVSDEDKYVFAQKTESIISKQRQDYISQHLVIIFHLKNLSDTLITCYSSLSTEQKEGGTQLKLLVTFEDEGQALFKPMR